MVDERLLQRMQRAVRRQSLDGGDLGAVLHDRQREAGIDPPPVDQHGAGAALAVIAALLGAGQIEMVAQRVEQGRPRRELELRLDAVDGQRYGILCGTGIDALRLRLRVRAICISGMAKFHARTAVPIGDPLRATATSWTGPRRFHSPRTPAGCRAPKRRGNDCFGIELPHHRFAPIIAPRENTFAAL